MEPTNKKGGKLLLTVVILIIIVVLVMMAMRNKTEAPTENNGLSGSSMTNSQLGAEVNSAVDFSSESSLQEIDKEYQ